MNMANNNDINILDLPNEILFIIVKKLNMVDVLYSLVDVNERFNELILNHFYIRHLNMTVKTMRSVLDHIFSIEHEVLDKICKTILPRIHYQINQLTIDPRSMNRVLTFNYPHLYTLSLVDFHDKMLLKYLRGDSILFKLLSEQITHLSIDTEMKTRTLCPSLISKIFVLILSLCKRLIYLNICSSCRYRTSTICIFKQPSTNCMSSTLTTLNIRIYNFADCLRILDGRLSCLSTLITHVVKIERKISKIPHMEKLPKLKYFSLISIDFTMGYDNLIIPLLQRMINLEELKLLLSVKKYDSTYIDGTQLHDQIRIYMPRLNKFDFSIITTVFNKNIKIDLVLDEKIQDSFIGRGYGQVGSHVQTNAMKNAGQCHIYSLPYQFEEFIHLNNSFQGGMFNKVRGLMMTDMAYPFERNFLQMISQDFPSLEELSIFNYEPQENKQLSSALIRFPHLLVLDLTEAHTDYVEQFLFHKITHLPRLLNLIIRYEPLAIVTNNFTNNAARLNCAKLKCIAMCEPFVRPENFDQYFPLLESLFLF